MSRFTDALVVTPLADGSTWVIVRAFGYDVGSEGSGDHIEVAIGFQTDFEAMGVLDVSTPVKYVLFWAVRLFGGLAWVRNRADRAAGFDRVLADVHLKASTPSQRPGMLRRLARHAWRRF